MGGILRGRNHFDGKCFGQRVDKAFPVKDSFYGIFRSQKEKELMQTITPLGIPALEAALAAPVESHSKRRRSILIYSPQFNTIGGVETHLVRLSCVLAQHDWDVTLVTTSGMLESTRVAQLSAAGVKFVAPAGTKPLSIPLKTAWLASTILTKLRKTKWDVIYTNAQGGMSWLLRPLRRKGTRLVHHYHTAGDERDLGTWTWAFVKWLHAVDEIVACSTSTAQNLRRVLNLPASRGGGDKIRVIRYLSEEIIPAPHQARAAGEQLRFGFVGRMVKGKGVDLICQLSTDAELAHVTWDLHGCGADYDADYFKQYPNVRFHGRYHGGRDLSGILSRLDALVLFSTYQEGQPISLIEGMAAGLPWIATDQGGTRELMWSPANCRMISSAAEFGEAKRAVLELAQAIREGKTSFAAQRLAYEGNLSPATVGARWMDFLAETPAPTLEGAWLGRVLAR